MALFIPGEFTGAAGQKLVTKIECDALTAEDWEGVAALAAERVEKFTAVSGVPRGGFPFAQAMERHVSPFRDVGHDTILVCEDVCTTGGSMERWANRLRGLHTGCRLVGVCLFARGESIPGWVTPLFSLARVYKDYDES